ncbi:MAG TPA: dihydropteroate synthase, partial [Candidatus Tectomicrobia bacterium]|nr:dihydropteroate synthase [Candidatus Tectomicrobia bacterium]
MSVEVRADLAGIVVGDGLPVAVVGALNVSEESFYRGSIHTEEAVLDAALEMVEAGAVMIDVGARSTAPYRAAEVAEADEARRLGRAV